MKLPNDPAPGSWGEIFYFTRAAFQVLLAPLGMMLGGVLVFVFLLYTLVNRSLLVVIPLAILGLGVWYLMRRDRRMRAQIDEEMYPRRTRRP